MGGWPVLKGQNWNNEAFNWQETIAKLRQFNNDILVTIWVGPDGKNSDDYVVQFDQSDLLLPSAEYYQLGFNHPIIQSYYNVLFNVATLLGADPALAKREMKDLIEFEMNLASVRTFRIFPDFFISFSFFHFFPPIFSRFFFKFFFLFYLDFVCFSFFPRFSSFQFFLFSRIFV